MRILWVSASPIGPAERILNDTYQGTSGSWIGTIFEELKNVDENQLFFLCFSKKVKKGSFVKKTSVDGVAYCFHEPSIHYGIGYPKKTKTLVESIIREISPHVIHIWGTETRVQNMVSHCCEDIPKVTFLQGLVGIHSRYYGGYLKQSKMKMPFSPIQYVKAVAKKHLFLRQTKYEKIQLLRSGNVILDNDFASAYVKSISEKINIFRYYLPANNVFFVRQWSYESCEKHTIFTVFGGGPDKGLHQLLIALSILKKKYKDILLRIPGSYHAKNGKLMPWKYLTPYEKLLFRLIDQHGLAENVVFLGRLSLEQMAEYLRNTNVFVNPSIMENHASSLREAMTVGTPSVTSLCGSVAEFVFDGVNAFLYRYEEPEVLAYRISKFFDDRALCEKISKNAVRFMQTKKETQKSLMDIYNDLV